MVLSKKLHNSIEITVEKLRNKEIVVIPTDTVYGFSGIAPWTEDYIRQIKGREENKPFEIERSLFWYYPFDAKVTEEESEAFVDAVDEYITYNKDLLKYMSEQK